MAHPQIVIVDYGVGNLLSVNNMVRKAGGQSKVSGDPAEIAAADKLILPGVGHFDHGMRMLNASGIRGALDEAVLQRRRPVLGICLGAQILGRGSEEGDSPGLGWIGMTCRRLPPAPGLRVPHMGWNQLELVKPAALLGTLEADARFYFVHSYYMECEDPADVAARSRHGIAFTSAVERGNIFGTQFHPEKSLRHGLAVMRAFVGLEGA